MRKLLILLLATVLGLGAIAQNGTPLYPVNQAVANATSTIMNTNAIKINGGAFVLGNYVDTTAANAVSYVKNYRYGLIITDTNRLWMRSYNAQQWIEWVANVPASPTTPSNVWQVGGNFFNIIPSAGLRIGSYAPWGGAFTIMTNGVDRLTVPDLGILPMSASDDSMLVRNTSGEIGVAPKGTATNAWNLTGNSATDSTINFLGTTDNRDLYFRVNNFTAGYIESTPDGSALSGGIAMGQFAGQLMIDSIKAGVTTGLKNNTLYGYGAGRYIGKNNSNSGQAASSENTFIGQWAGYYTQQKSSATGYGRNVAVGQSAMFNNIDGGENTAIGTFSLERNWMGNGNAAVGRDALRSNIDGSYNAAVGHMAMTYTTTGIASAPIVLGGSGYTTATVTFSTPLAYAGPGVCISTATGTVQLSGGAVIGITITDPGCGYSSISGTTFGGIVFPPVTATISGDGVGATASTVLQSASYNSALGVTAGIFNRIGQYNTYVGYQSGYSTRHNDSYMTFLGTGSDVDGSIGAATNLTKSAAIGYNAKVAGSNMIILGGTGADAVKVGIGTISPDSTLHNVGSFHNTSNAKFDAKIHAPNLAAGNGTKTVRWDATNGFVLADTTTGGGTVPISSLTAATGTNSINNAAYVQEWQWNSLAGGNGLYLTSSSTAATGNTQSLFQSILTGVNSNSTQTTYAGSFGNGHTGTASTNVSGYFYSSNGETNIGGQFLAQGGTNNYAIIVPASSGSVGIGTSTPTSILHVVPVHTTGLGVAFASSTTTSGTILDITGTSTALAANNEGLNIAISGANGTNAITATGARISVTNTNGTSGTNVGLDVTASGATTANNAIRATGNVLVEGTGNYIMGRWRARVDSTTSSATPSINTDNVDVFKITALSAAISSMTSSLSGTPQDGDILEVVITDNGTARAITWGSSFVSTTVTLPATTTLGVTLTTILQYYKSSSYGNNKWHCVNYY